MSMSHKNCSHPSTSKARAECRKQQDTSTQAYHAEMQDLQDERLTITPKKRNIAKANTKAAAKTHAIIDAAISKLDKRPTCYLCDKHAGWIDTTNAQPVCMAHVDWDHVRLIPQ